MLSLYREAPREAGLTPLGQHKLLTPAKESVWLQLLMLVTLAKGLFVCATCPMPQLLLEPMRGFPAKSEDRE